MSSTACSTPFFSCAPNAAFGPVTGPATPILIWACAAPETARPRPSAMPASSFVFIQGLLWMSLRGPWTGPASGEAALAVGAHLMRLFSRKSSKKAAREGEGLGSTSRIERSGKEPASGGLDLARQGDPLLLRRHERSFGLGPSPRQLRRLDRIAGES